MIVTYLDAAEAPARMPSPFGPPHPLARLEHRIEKGTLSIRFSES